jgi:tight adherence protein B
MIVLLLFRTNIITIIAVFIIGLSLPPFLLRRAHGKRQEVFTKQLGEALVVMGNAMKGGFSFRQAMESVTADMQPPISVEFEKTLREIRFGISLEEALEHMSERLKNQDLNLLVSAVITSAKVGGNLSDILDTISSTIKDRIRIKQEVRVLTSSGRMSSLIIGLLPVLIVLVLMILNPDYFGSFFESTIGRIMIAVSVLLEIIGFLLIKKIADIKY